MNAILIAMFVSASAQGLPASRAGDCVADAPCAPVRTLAGKAARLDAVVDRDDRNEFRQAIHSTGEGKPAFDPSAKRPVA